MCKILSKLAPSLVLSLAFFMTPTRQAQTLRAETAGSYRESVQNLVVRGENEAEFTLVAPAQDRPDPRLLAFINTIRAVDNHSHALPVSAPPATAATPADPLGTSPPFFSVRQR